MAQQAGARRRPAKPAAGAGAQAPGFPWTRLILDGLGFALLALSLTSILSSLHAEGAIAEPLGRFLYLTFGWLGPIAAVWPGVIALILLAQRIAPRPWPRARLSAGAGAMLAALGLAALEAFRRGGWDAGPANGIGGGGIVGRAIAQTLV